jgi:hypothetical protein
VPNASADRATSVKDCAWATPLVLVAAALCMPFSVAAGPHLYDAGELAAAAWSLGGSHPPGQPLHALLAHYAALLPFGPIPARFALFSAACAIIAAWLAARFARALALQLGAPRADAELGAAVAAIAVLIAEPVLRQALRIEVYTLALALALGASLALLRWAQSRSARALWRAAFLAGLAAAVHPPYALAIALAAGGFAACQPELLTRRPARVIAGSVFFGALGACAYAYLPARAAAGANMWGDAISVRGLWSYVSAKAYAQNLSTAENRSVIGIVFDHFAFVLQQGGVAAWSGALAASALVARPASRVLLGAVVASALALLAACVIPLEPRNPDNVAYMAPCVTIAFATAGAAYAALRTRIPWLGTTGLVLVLLVPLGLLRWDERWGDLPALETLGGALLDTPPPRALVVATTDFTAATWMMQQDIEGARPDAAMFVAGLSTSSWMWKRLQHHPALRGKPVRGPGRDAHEQYLTGAVLRALPRVPVALEREVAGVRVAQVTGAYLLAASSAASARDVAQSSASIGDRLSPAIAAAAARGADGDAGAAAAIVRDYQHERALRLFALGRAGEALREIDGSLWPLDAAERAALRVPAGLRATSTRLPRMVSDPKVFLIGLEDCVRSAAVMLWTLGRTQAADELLGQQAQRGDARALLQLAWLQLARGDREAAQRSMGAFLHAAPELHDEGAALASALRR